MKIDFWINCVDLTVEISIDDAVVDSAAAVDVTAVDVYITAVDVSLLWIYQYCGYITAVDVSLL